MARQETTASTYDPVQTAFDNAVDDFRKGLKDESLYAEILQTTSIEQVYEATDELQAEQYKHGRMRHLSKISPYLARLNEYAATVEVFIQAKQDVMVLIWGPIKLLLQMADALKSSFDAIITVTAEIGEVLPNFQEAAKLFSASPKIGQLLLLFFKDILDFYSVALRFFRLSRELYGVF